MHNLEASIAVIYATVVSVNQSIRQSNSLSEFSINFNRKYSSKHQAIDSPMNVTTVQMICLRFRPAFLHELAAG